MTTPNWKHNSGKEKKGKGTCKGRLRSRRESLRQLKKRHMDRPKGDPSSYYGYIPEKTV